jgi:hypothetical protein
MQSAFVLWCHIICVTFEIKYKEQSSSAQLPFAAVGGPQTLLPQSAFFKIFDLPAGPAGIEFRVGGHIPAGRPAQATRGPSARGRTARSPLAACRLCRDAAACTCGLSFPARGRQPAGAQVPRPRIAAAMASRYPPGDAGHGAWRHGCDSARPGPPAGGARAGGRMRLGPSGVTVPTFRLTAPAAASALRWNPLAAQGPKAVWRCRVPRV